MIGICFFANQPPPPQKGSQADYSFRGVEPLTPEDIAEVVVFSATRRENVVIADTLIFPQHQVSDLTISQEFNVDA